MFSLFAFCVTALLILTFKKNSEFKRLYLEEQKLREEEEEKFKKEFLGEEDK